MTMVMQLIEQYADMIRVREINKLTYFVQRMLLPEASWFNLN